MPESRLQRTREAYIEPWEPREIEAPKPSDHVMIFSGGNCYSIPRRWADAVFVDMGFRTTGETRAIADAS